MSIAISADLHIWNHKRHGGALIKGINHRGQLCLDTVAKAVAIVNQDRADWIIAGDTVDSAGPIQPQLAMGISHALVTERKTNIILGNHDMTAIDDDSLGLYEQSTDYASVQVCRDIGWTYGGFISDCPLGGDEEICLVPFHCDITDERVRDISLVVAHFGVYDDSFSKWCANDKKAWHVDKLFAFMQERNIKGVLIGDWHSRSGWQRITPNYTINHLELPDSSEPPINRGGFNTELGPVIMQIGALIPTGWDNPGLHGYGTVALWDGERLSWQEVPGSRFCVAKTESEEKAIIAEAKQLGHNLFLRRYYSGDKPSIPEGVEAYEALPIALEQAVLIAAEQAGFVDPKAELNRLTSEWLDQYGDDKNALTEHMRRYL